jgi:ATP-dependent exoDNAse (exonuclease V) beta subunit
MNQSTEMLHRAEYVKAGAGAGKTFKITQKVSRLVKQGAIRPEKILAVTFTNAAANEMRSRIRADLLKYGLREEAEKVKEATISTIHGFGLQIIERFAFEKGLSPNPRQLTVAEEDALIRNALAQVNSIDHVLAKLNTFGYKGNYNGAEYIDSVTQFKSRILSVIKKIRSIGKGESTEQAANLIEDAFQDLDELYGHNLSNPLTLNDALWNALQSLRTKYPNVAVLMELWGSNAAARSFIETAYAVKKSDLETDWTVWKGLQTIKAPKIEKSDDAYLAEAIWMAADKLSVHPGPLNEAKAHIQSLLEGAIETLQLYQTAKDETGLVDFSDMVHLADVIMQNPVFMAEMTARYDCLIIDEFQDTNPLQFSLLNRFQQAGVPTLIVGDLKQSIMGFQGSDARLFAGLLEKGEQSADIEVDELVNNWRSTPKVMEFVNAMGTQLYGERYQPLSVTAQAAYESELPAIHKLVFDNGNWAATAQAKNKHSMNRDAYCSLANYIKSMLENGIQVFDKHSKQKRALRPSDIAVLGAKHGTLQEFSDVLNQFGVKTKLTQSGYIESEAVQWVFSGLQYVANTSNHYALLNLLTSDYAQLSLQSLLETFFEKRIFSHSSVEALREVAKQARLQDFPAAVSLVIEALGLWDRLIKRSDYVQQKANVLKLIQLAKVFEETQPESLEAMGIFGKNLNTFLVWLNESASQKEFDQQPQADANPIESVVLSTWHASKGLEWPVVMVLNMHDERKVGLPSIDVAYQSDNVDQMLDTSYVRFLMEFADPKTKERMQAPLELEGLDTLKNLTYVALTRARESLILPWFDNDKPGTMLGLIRPLFDSPRFELQETNMVYVDAPQQNNEIESNQVLDLVPMTIDKIPAVVSPSVNHSHATEALELKTQIAVYGAPLDLTQMDQGMAANEIGTWVHKLYQINLMNPALIERGFELLPASLREEVLIQQMGSHLESFRTWLENTLTPISIICEMPILSKNDKGQTVSGTIDLLVETEQGYWIIDHKTDQVADMAKHFEQLQAYQNAIRLPKPVVGLSINWVRESKIEFIEV